jgi:hypothetical protein
MEICLLLTCSFSRNFVQVEGRFATFIETTVLWQGCGKYGVTRGSSTKQHNNIDHGLLLSTPELFDVDFKGLFVPVNYLYQKVLIYGKSKRLSIVVSSSQGNTSITQSESNV